LRSTRRSLLDSRRILVEMHAAPTMTYAKAFAFQANIVARLNVC